VDAGSDTGTNPSGCQTTGGTTVPATGAVMTATFSDPVNFNGSTTPFTSVGPGVAVQNVNESRVVSNNSASITLGDKTAQSITLAFERVPVACKEYKTTDAPAAAAPNISLRDNAQGLWWCGGTLIIDTVNGQAITFHFDTTCKANPVGNPSTGTVKLSGKGAATLAVN